MDRTLPPLDNTLDELRTLVDAELERLVDQFEAPPNLRDAVAYAVLSPGKRLRPICSMLCAEAAGGSRQRALGPAARLELVHAFSLVHDDLPAMDDDVMRRGRPTLHVHTSEAMAILAGDVLLAMAFEWRCPDAATTLEVHEEIASATRRMIAGQVYDTIGGLPEDASADQALDTIHRLKTGALFEAACRIGGRAVGATPDILGRLGRFGAAIGLMFQAVDDLLDETQSAEHLGKGAGKDRAAGKVTYPGIHGLDATRERIHDLALEALGEIEPLEDTETLRQLVDHLAARTR